MHRDKLATCLSGLLLTLPCTAAAADAAAPASQQAPRADEELSEVVVEGQRVIQRKPQQSFDWLARLVGEFTIDGYVHPTPGDTSSDLQDVHGHALCVGFGIAPGVQCELRVRWPDATGPDGSEVPGGVSTLDPAVMLFGFNLGTHVDVMYGAPLRPGEAPDMDTYTIAHMMIDNKGVAEGGAGYRMGTDTMTSRSPCVAIPVDCERVVVIAVPADLQTVEMRIDLEIKKALAMRYKFVMHRVPDSESVVYGRKPP